MKNGLFIAGVIAVIGAAITIPILFYGTIAYVVIHFIKKFW